MSSTKPTSMSASNDVPLSKIMSDIEAKTEKKVDELMKPTIKCDTTEKINYIKKQSTDFGDKLIEIMSEGANEFKEKTGRNMTYSEMRQLYG